MAALNGVIAIIDKALASYYSKLDTSYYNNDGVGKFAFWCDENGFEDSDIREEFQHDPADCLLVDFDPDFPFQNNNLSDPERLKAIYAILVGIAEKSNGDLDRIDKLLKDAKSKNHLLASAFINQVTDNAALVKAKQVYKIQLSGTLDGVGLADDTLFEFLSLSFTNNNYPFLNNLVDSFTRDRIAHRHLGKINPYGVMDWALHNPFCKNMAKSHKAKQQRLTSAIKSYCLRICPKLQFIGVYKINDDICDISMQICCATRFIYNLIQTQNTLPPFQFDLIFGLNDVTNTENNSKPDIASDDEDLDDKDDNNDNDSDDNQSNGSGSVSTSDNDVIDDIDIGNVKEKLTANNLVYATGNLPLVDVNDDDNKWTISPIITVQTRAMVKSYTEFKTKYGKMVRNNDNNNNAPGFPHYRRFCCFLERRTQIDDNNELIWYNPPSNCNEIPRGHVREWGFEASRTCLIPGKTNPVTPKPDAVNNMPAKPKPVTPKPGKAITALTPCKGKLLTFSFHVEALDKIKCYMYWMGQVMRFYPQDIIEVLPLLFDKSTYKNGEFTKRKLATRFAEQTKLNDFQFEQFYRDCSKLTEQQFPKYSTLVKNT